VKCDTTTEHGMSLECCEWRYDRAWDIAILKERKAALFIQFHCNTVNHPSNQFLNCALSNLNINTTGWTVWGSIPDRTKRFFSSPKCPD